VDRWANYIYLTVPESTSKQDDQEKKRTVDMENYLLNKQRTHVVSVSQFPTDTINGTLDMQELNKALNYGAKYVSVGDMFAHFGLFLIIYVNCNFRLFYKVLALSI
jgi:hypothetical protein